MEPDEELLELEDELEEDELLELDDDELELLEDDELELDEEELELELLDDELELEELPEASQAYDNVQDPSLPGSDCVHQLAVYAEPLCCIWSPLFAWFGVPAQLFWVQLGYSLILSQDAAIAP